MSNKNESDEAKWTVLLKIGDTPVSFKIDTRADVTVMNTVTSPKSSAPSFEPRRITKLHRTVHCRSEHKGREYAITVYVVAGGTVSNLLSRQTAAEMGLVKRIEY